MKKKFFTPTEYGRIEKKWRKKYPLTKMARKSREDEEEEKGKRDFFW